MRIIDSDDEKVDTSCTYIRFPTDTPTPVYSSRPPFKMIFDKTCSSDDANGDAQSSVANVRK